MATRKAPSRRAAEEARSKRQIYAIILFAVGLFLAALSFIEGASLWKGLRGAMFGLLGPGAFFIAPLFIYVAIMTTLDKPVGTIGGKVWQTAVLILMISAAVQVFSYGALKEEGLWDCIVELYEAGNELNGGGVLSSVIALPLIACGDLPARIVTVLLLFVFIMIFSGATLIGLYHSAMRPVRHISNTYAERVQSRREEEIPDWTPPTRSYALQDDPSPRSAPETMPPEPGSGRFNVDVPLDQEAPPPRKKRQKRAEPEADTVDVAKIFERPKASPAPPAEEPDPFDSVPQGSFARKSIESSVDSAREALFSAAHPAGKFEFDFSPNAGILRDMYNGPVTSDGLPLETPPDTEETNPFDEIPLEEDVPEPPLPEMAAPLHFRNSPPPPRPQTTDEVIDEILRRALTPDDGPAPEPVSEAPDPVFDDDVGQKLQDSLDDAVREAEESEPPPAPHAAPAAGAPSPAVPAVPAAGLVRHPSPFEAAYAYPPISLLSEPKWRAGEDSTEELKANAQRLVDTLQSFGVQTRVIDIAKGPAVTRYELQPSAGVKISKITSLADDIALNLAAAGVRIEAPIPNKPAVGIEVPNKNVDMVQIREIIDSDEFRSAKSPLTIALGRDISGRVTIADAAKMPHMLIAGSTGSGKSVCINSIIISLLYKSPPDQVKLLMVDPKVVELGIYNGIPHLLVPVVTDPKKAAGALAWSVSEMLKRYQQFAENQVRDIAGYNRLCQSRPELAPMPQVVIIIDELADLMMAAPGDVEDSICRLAQMARAAGMHLIIATQRPSVDVITGVIKANIPSRIAFAVSSSVDSRTILDSGGAEKLLGRGDMLFYPVGAPKPQRVQGCFVSDQEVEAVVEFIKRGGESEYDDKVMEEIERQAAAEKGKKRGSDTDDEGGGFEEEDDMLPAAIECVVEMGMASTSLLQRKLKLGYARAARIVDQLEEKGIVGPFEGSKPRQVLMTREQLYEMKMNQEP